MSNSTLRQLKDLPGPRGMPLLGNTLQVKPPRIHLDVEAWAAEFGPIFRMQLGRRHQLVIADHELLAAVLRDRPEGFRRSPLTNRIGTEMGLPQGLFGSEGEDWRRQRRMVMASFAPGHVRAYFPSLVKVTLRLRSRWHKAVRQGQDIPLQADLMRFTVDAIAGLAFGKDINTLESGEDVIQRHLDKVLPAIFRRVLSLVPYWRWFKLESDRELERSVAVINSTILEFVAQARQRLHDEPSRHEQPRNLLEAMIAAADQPDSGLDDRHVAGNVLTMLLAGEDTTANTLAWMIHLLHRNPQALQRVQQEVRMLAPDPAAYSFDQMEQLVYLEACASETMRLKPVAPFIALQALRDTVVADVAVPEGTLIWGVLRHDSVSEQHFARPEAFEPERWLDGADPPLSSAAKRSAMPFGSGPRMCPGRYLALLEIKMAMAMLLSSFDIEAVATPGDGPAEERMAFTMNPVGLRMRLREAAAVPAAP
jgi:cytochrome P450